MLSLTIFLCVILYLYGLASTPKLLSKYFKLYTYELIYFSIFWPISWVVMLCIKIKSDLGIYTVKIKPVESLVPNKVTIEDIFDSYEKPVKFNQPPPIPSYDTDPGIRYKL